MNLYQETKFLMNQYHITAKKNLGQNFLIDETVITDAIESAEIGKEDLVIEIGPGLGTLTHYLLESAGKVIAVELDNNMLPILKKRFSLYSNFELIHGDVLKINLKEVIKREKESDLIKKVKIVANLPYYITTPIIMKLLEEKLEIESITVMIQKEVAERLTEIPGGKNTGAITYAVYYYADAKKVRTVSNQCFIPPPGVESEVIHLRIREKPVIEVQKEEEFFKLIKYAFMQRRKTLLNALGNSGIVEKETLRKVLKNNGISEKVRGENLTIEQFAKISNEIS